MKISAIVAPFNEERHIEECLQGLLGQRGVGEDLEIIVVDGMSTDRTREIVQSFPEYGTRITMLENPRRLQVYALNIGLRAAIGEYVALISAHAHYGPSYLSSCLDVMNRMGATAVGGVQVPSGESALGKAIAWCMSSPFGVGNARYRYARKEEEVDSLFSIFTLRDVLETLGGFDERFPYDEDSDLSYRLRRSGGKLVVSPAIEIKYHVRRSLTALSRQMYRYGYWRRFTQLAHANDVPLRVYAPAALVAVLTLSVALANSPLRALPWALLASYGAFLAVAIVVACIRLRAYALLVPIVLATMHVSYGVGWWVGLISFRSIPEPE